MKKNPNLNSKHKPKESTFIICNDCECRSGFCHNNKESRFYENQSETYDVSIV